MNKYRLMWHMEQAGFGKKTLKKIGDIIEKYQNETPNNSSSKMYELIKKTIDIKREKEESFWLFFFDNKLNFLHCELIGRGNVSEVYIHMRRVVRAALDCNGARMIAVHNHPSGYTEPSDSDFNLTQNIKNIGSMIECELIDHLIVSEYDYYSFSENFAL